MLVGSQLKNAQVEVVADLTAAGLLVDPVVGRIIYVRNLGQLFIYDDGTPGDSVVAGWKPINTAEDSLALLNTKSDQITGATGGAAPVRTIKSIEELQDDIIDGTQTMFANKRTPQEMCHTWNLNGTFSGNQLHPDGSLTLPFDAEVTGISADIYYSGTSGFTDFHISYSTTIDGSFASIFDVNGKFDSGPDYQQHMYLNNVIAATGVVQEDAVTSGMSNASGGDVIPELDVSALTLVEGGRLHLIAGSTAPEMQDLTVTIFFRRRNNG